LNVFLVFGAFACYGYLSYLAFQVFDGEMGFVFALGGISLDYGSLTFSLPIAAHAEIEVGDSTNEQRRVIHAEFYTPRRRGATDDFPARELTPVSAWNYALCLNEEPLTRLVQIEWKGPSAETLFDSAQPFVTLRVPVHKVNGWDVQQRRDILQENNWVSGGMWRSGLRRVKGTFSFTPPLRA
jgi:hypothetical protein